MTGPSAALKRDETLPNAPSISSRRPPRWSSLDGAIVAVVWSGESEGTGWISYVGDIKGICAADGKKCSIEMDKDIDICVRARRLSGIREEGETTTRERRNDVTLSISAAPM